VTYLLYVSLLAVGEQVASYAIRKLNILGCQNTCHNQILETNRKKLWDIGVGALAELLLNNYIKIVL